MNQHHSGIILLIFMLGGNTQSFPNVSARLPDKHMDVLDRYCMECHDSLTEKGGFNLEALPFDLDTIEHAEKWQKVLNAMNSGEMPPEDKHQLKFKEKASVLEDLSDQLVLARKILSDTGGVITMRRLNRREYKNTIRSLLGVEVDVSTLPADTTSSGFDTNGSALFFSSDQFEQYLELAKKALNQAIIIGDKPILKRERTEVEIEANRRIRNVFRGYQRNGYIAYKKWKASKGGKPSDFGLVDEAEINFRKMVWDLQAPSFADYLTREENLNGAFLTVDEPNPQVNLVIPDDSPSGIYKIRAKIAVNKSAKPDPSRTFVEVGFRGEKHNTAIDLIDCIKVNAPMRNPEIIETDVFIAPSKKPMRLDIGTETKKKVKLGERVIVFRQRHVNSRDASNYIRRKHLDETGFNIEPSLWVDWVEWEGPIIQHWPPLAHQSIFDIPEETDQYAREILLKFSQRAFRGRSPSSEFLDRLMIYHREEMDKGSSFKEAIKTPLSIILASPSFLFLSETIDHESKSVIKKAGVKQGANKSFSQINTRELAVRLSYFLWGAPPDQILMSAVVNNNLKSDREIENQVYRMINHDRIKEFIVGFTYQWLHLERLDFFNFNYRLYPDFDSSVKEAAKQEVYETLLHLIKHAQPLKNLLKYDTIVINELLADFYGIENVRGKKFRSINIPANIPRGGLLGMSAILAMGSDGERSSPVERGAWVLRKLLHQPPPPAPPNVPQISRHAGKLLPARELLDMHMEEPQCAQCHRKIDPVGFGLENFNAVGLWREKEYVEIATKNRVSKSKLHDIDSSGQLANGQHFNGFFELRDAIATQHENFTRGFVEHLIEYALGRPYGFTDLDLANEILEKAKKQGNTIQAFILALAQSDTFKIKR